MRRSAAALLITRGSGEGVEVFLAERSRQLRFFGGYWALPGGTIDSDDGDGTEAAAMQACGRRELFEETGLLWQRLRRAHDRNELATLRRTMVERDAPRDGKRGGHGSPVGWRELERELDGAPLRELCRIETPPFVPVRYDTVFFHVPLEHCSAGSGEHAEPEVWPGELTQGRFWRPADALAAWRRGEIYIVPPILILLEHVAAAADADALAAALAETAASYRAGRLHEVRFSPGIVLAPLRTPTLPPATTTNCYVVGHEQLFVVDPGSPHAEEQQRLNRLLDELEARGARTAGILLTHHHPDHVGGVTALSRARGLPVHAHPLTLSRTPVGFLVGDELEDGSEIALGRAPDDGAADGSAWHLTAIHTPGHDRGHLCFRESRYGTALVGDMLSTMSTIIIDPPEGHLASYLASLDRLAERPITTLYPAHGPAVRDGERLIAQYVRHRRQRETALVKALEQGGGTLDELLPKVYWDADPKLYGFAARSLLAGLEKLAEEGRAVLDGERWRAHRSA
ncbi:MAG: MBL fold metallo-hydrolase [Planctomycetes bacterium]|nr:MBL fold metallo-hydrolase [Planctomycetota bacterium]